MPFVQVQRLDISFPASTREEKNRHNHTSVTLEELGIGHITSGSLEVNDIPILVYSILGPQLQWESLSSKDKVEINREK